MVRYNIIVIVVTAVHAADGGVGKYENRPYGFRRVASDISHGPIIYLIFEKISLFRFLPC